VDYLRYFDVKNNNLFLDDRNLVELSRKYGTPLIVYSKRKIQENVKKLSDAFNADYLSVIFSIKSNFNPALLSILREMGVGFDAANLNEVLLALRVGASADRIIATPNNLSKDELAKISAEGVILNFDDVGQMELIKDNLPNVVSFRVNPGIGKGEFKGITTGGKGSKFGMPPEAANNAYKTAKAHGCKRFGIHMMTGSNVLDPSFFRQSSRMFFSIAERIAQDNDIEFEFLDIGGGLGVPYKKDEEELDIRSVAKYILENFEDSRSRGFFKNCRLVIEPGRYIIANTGVLLGRVANVKSYDGLYIGTDVGMNSLIRAPLYGATHPILVANKATDPHIVKCNIGGQVCENTDILFKGVSLPEIEEGDTIAFLNCGAYVSSMASNYNLLKRPVELLLDGSEEIIIKRKESLDDMLNTFALPLGQ
jgi:diaminopimelate decarboxylase